MIETRELVVTYGDLVAVDRLDLHIPAGSCYGFIGPNGAGKTSTMRVLATLLPPTSGTLTVCGHDVIREPDAVKKSIGYMPDFFGVYDQLTVEEYLEFFALVYGVETDAIPARIDDTLARVRLDVKKEAYIDTLSRGMKQRLSLGRAFIHNPPVLILDEPASGLDPRARKELRLLLRELQQEGKTIFISSHVLLELADICDHAAIIEAGKMVVAGPITEILKNVRKTRCIAIRLCEPPGDALAAEMRSALPLQSATIQDNVLLLEMEDTDEAVARTVAFLAGKGAGIVEVRSAESNLEEIFEKVTKGIVR